jgi:uncharacterized membrane protein YhaH (DUF805 family)
MKYYSEAMQKYANFSGRTRRKGYWMFMLIHYVIMIAICLVESSLKSPFVIFSLYFIGTIVPTLSITSRRLHDSNLSGWWMLIAAIPYIGGLVLAGLMLRDSQPGQNQYGANPKEIAA